MQKRGLKEKESEFKDEERTKLGVKIVEHYMKLKSSALKIVFAASYVGKKYILWSESIVMER